MATTYESVNVKCPFYKEDARNQIRCEGICETSTSTVHMFRDQKTRLKYQKKYCEARYKDCPCFRQNMTKYE